jgi:hypothetical protein
VSVRRLYGVLRVLFNCRVERLKFLLQKQILQHVRLESQMLRHRAVWKTSLLLLRK